MTGLLKLYRKGLTSMGRAAYPAALWAATRAGLVLFSWLSLWVEPRQARFPPAHEAWLRSYPWIDGFCRWDCGWYLKIATRGYREYVDANIWPFYPLLTRIFAVVTRVPIIPSLIIVANLISLLSWLVLYRVFVPALGPREHRHSIPRFPETPDLPLSRLKWPRVDSGGSSIERRAASEPFRVTLCDCV